MNAVAYVDFQKFRDELSEADRRALSATRILFCYPVLNANEYELAEHPVSQRLLMGVARAAGVMVEAEMARVDNGVVSFSGDSTQAPDFLVLHPMIGTLDLLPAIVDAYKARFPHCAVVLQTSDQHQHEKLIGGPKARDLAQALLDRITGADWAIRGYAEHALLSLVLGRPSGAVLGRGGDGAAPIEFFTMQSLPDGDLPGGDLPGGDLPGGDLPSLSGNRGKSIRVQRARGCLSGCTYCIEGQANKAVAGERSWDGLAVDDFVDHLAELADQGYFFINVIDSSFEDPGRRGLTDLLHFCDLVIARGLRLSFKIHLRAENALRLSPADLEKMKAAGIDVIVCGLESGSQEELDFYRKIATKDQARAAFNHLEAPGLFCNILGYMMFAPISTGQMLREKVEFLRDIGRGWDFLNLTNRVLVFWGTAVHRQLIDLGLAEDCAPHLGYVPYRIDDPTVAALDKAFNRVKNARPEFAKLNNLIYDALNLESRLLNPANAQFRALAGERFETFRTRLSERMARLSQMYCDGFLHLLDDPTAAFLPDFDAAQDCADQQDDIFECLKFIDDLPVQPETLYLHTWLSVVNRFGVKAP